MKQTNYTMTQQQGAARIQQFLKQFQQKYQLRFISKPAGVDIARLRYCLETFGPRPTFPIHHTSYCVLTLQHAAQVLMGNEYNHHIRMTRMLYGVAAHTSHFPIDDCRAQIADVVACENMLLQRTKYPPPLTMNNILFT